MNIEHEVKVILRSGYNREHTANMICALTTFNKEKVIKGIQKGGEKVHMIYNNILIEHGKK